MQRCLWLGADGSWAANRRSLQSDLIANSRHEPKANMLMGMQAFGIKHGAEGPGAILNACSQAGVWDWASWQHLIAFPAMLALVLNMHCCLPGASRPCASTNFYEPSNRPHRKHGCNLPVKAFMSPSTFQPRILVPWQPARRPGRRPVGFPRWPSVHANSTSGGVTRSSSMDFQILKGLPRWRPSTP